MLPPPSSIKRRKSSHGDRSSNSADSGTPFLVFDNETGYISTENPNQIGRHSASTNNLDALSILSSYEEEYTTEQSLEAGTSDSFMTEDSPIPKGINCTRELVTPKMKPSKAKTNKKQPMKMPFSKRTPCFSTETPIILATARHSGSSISTSCNRESIRMIQNSGGYSGQGRGHRGQSSMMSSAYFTKTGSSSTSLASGTKTSFSSANAAQTASRIAHDVGLNNDSRADDNVISTTDIRQIRTVDRTNESMDSQIYMSALWQSGKLGMAYYDVETTCIYAMLDKQENDSFHLLRQVIKQISPLQIVLSSKQDERLIHAIKNQVENSHNESISEGQTSVQFLPSIDFAVEMCKRRVISMDLASVPDHYTDHERTLYMSSLVSFENICMIRALGGLLKFLEKMRIGIELEEAGTKLPVLDVKIFSVEEQMILDDTAYNALQIFRQESHPSVYKTGTGHSGREGLSLFGILNRTKSKAGSQMLRTWFQRPLKSLSLIRSRHDAVDFLINPRNMELVDTLEDSLKHVKNITRILTRMKQSHVSVGDWQTLYKTVYSATCIKEACYAKSQSISIFKKITEKFSDDLNRVTNLIGLIVDFPESSQQGRFVVRSHVDEKLDNVKRTFEGLPDFLSKVAQEELKQLGDEVTECIVLYMPQVGYLLAVPEAALVNISSDSTEGYHIEGLEFVVRGYRIVELDNMLGDTRCDINDMETTIMHKLQDSILEHTDVLLSVIDILAELDCLLSLAVCAKEYGYTRPNMTEENVIEVQGGRHPIQEMCCGAFVPNDIQSNTETGKIKVLTGPNACGKSVYLKQVPLIVFLAQIGSFVPAESARLGLIDRIFTRVSSLESVSVTLSTFMIDVNQMSDAIRNAGKNSLCVVDEFGKGTDMIDGVSLLVSCLKYWLNTPDCPHVFVCTHFHSIIHQHLLPRTPLIKYMTLETLHNGDDLVFLYQLVEGHTTSSYACHVASQAGLPAEIIKRGTETSELIRQCKPIQRIDTVRTDTQYRRCSLIVEKLMELNLEETDIRHFLTDFVLPTIEGKT